MNVERDRRGWHLDKRINLAYMLGSLTLAGSILVWAMNTESRTAVLEESALQIRERVSRVQELHEKDFGVLQGRFDRQDRALIRIENKIERLQEQNSAD